MANPTYGSFPPMAQRAFAILSTASSEPHPDGLLVVNQGGILSTYVKVGAGHYTFHINETSPATVDNTGCSVNPSSDSSASEDANFASYLIEPVTDSPSLLHVFVFDAAGAARDALNVTIILWGYVGA